MSLQFDKPKPKVKDTALLKKILENEKPGFLNWMLDGLDKLRKDDFKFTLNKKLSSQVDDFLMSSRAPEIFVEDRLEEKEGAELTKEMVTKCYHEYCKERDWPMGGSKDYPARIEANIAKMFGITVLNSLKPKGKDQGTVKGWYGVQIIDPDL